MALEANGQHVVLQKNARDQNLEHAEDEHGGCGARHAGFVDIHGGKVRGNLADGAVYNAFISDLSLPRGT